MVVNDDNLPGTAQPQSGEVSAPARRLPGRARDFPIVGIGASAGGLEACRKLLTALPANNGMAFILVQHLDPTHESMMVDLLAGHTAMAVRQAADGMPLQPDHFYVIPPGTYLSVAKGALHLSEPQARHGARLPFDFLLHSLAEEYGPRAIGVILSGTGTDGSAGLKSVKEKFGLVIAQDPGEATYDGMPRSAIKTGAVDLVLPVADIPAALATYGQRMAGAPVYSNPAEPERAPDWLPGVVALLRSKTGHDFKQYKPGTLQRRIERRMAIAGIEIGDIDRYRDLLESIAAEIELLAKDLLIHVTSFFRDPRVFDVLAEKILPDLIRGRGADQPLRIWVAGCSTGEETYSLAMLFHEQIATVQASAKLQIFASDVDPDAIASARDGFYPETIEADVSPKRLGRFFSKEDRGYRVAPELRASVVFTVQDVLADPPFSRLDLVSCRNLLIYLQPAAQAKVVALFHFALRQGGILLLGTSETVGNAEDRFAVISKPERLYRHIGRARPEEFGPAAAASDGVRVPARPAPGQPPSRQAVLAELCRRLVLDAYAPAAVLINRNFECLYSLGPTDRYLRIAPGHPTHDLLAMARQGLLTRLRPAIQQASQENTRVVVPGGRTRFNGHSVAFNVDVRPLASDGEELLLICFVDEPTPEPKQDVAGAHQDNQLVAELERELQATRKELQDAVRNLEISSEEQRTINEEALSVNEEYQSTNEELVTSKEELQSLNEELTALNSQLQETMERHRTTANDLQNVLYSTDVATLFLDNDLNIRFFTPATRLLFNVIPTDIGRPLADLSSLSPDGTLPDDAATVLRTLLPLEREVQTRAGAWYLRRVLPYRTQDNGAEGVVVTFADITERRQVAEALEFAKRRAELASVAKSRFLAAASHDLRQPLQTLMLLQGVLAQTVAEEKGQHLVERFSETLDAMTDMLDTLLDINQIEAGVVRADMVNFPIGHLLERMAAEFTDHAQGHAQPIVMRVVPCSLIVRSDPRLLEQMVRNLLTNALKYTVRGKVLLGCRRRGRVLSIEVWDTGIGIPAEELQAIFEEYHQLGNPARERSRGLGLGLSIVQRLANLLGHRIHVRSRPGKGSMFAIEVESLPDEAASQSAQKPRGADVAVRSAVRNTGAVLVVEDDPDLRSLLALHLNGEGYRTAVAEDATEALDLIARGAIHPDLVIADYNLPNGMNGLDLATRLQDVLHHRTPIIILTGDISTSTLRDIALRHFTHINKPVQPKELTHEIQRLLAAAQAEPRAPAPQPADTAAHIGLDVIFVVDDDSKVRGAIRSVLEAEGHTVEDFASCETFLDAYRPGREACLLIDAYLPGMSGLELLQRLERDGHRLPSIMITGNSDVPMAVRAMKAGASDFIEKPIGRDELLACVGRALAQSRDASELSAWREAATDHIAGLTARQREIMERVLAGHPSKNIAADLGISQRTVENHRAAIMKKTGTKSLPALARLALAANWKDVGEPHG